MTRFKHILALVVGLAALAVATASAASAGNDNTLVGDPEAPLVAGKWAHPEDLPANAEQPEASPAYENASSTISGTAFLPVILADFSDNPAERTLHTPAAFQSMLFQDGYLHGAGSLRDYYQDQSGGQFDVTGQVSNWVQMPKTYSTYVGSDQGMQDAEPNDWTLVKDAAAAADSTMNYCQGDTDGDGFVDALFVVHAGAGAEEGDVSSRIWSVRWELPTPYTTQDVCANGQRVKIKDFTIEPEEYVTAGYTAPGAPERMIAIGIFAHEFGHALGLPDLYDTDYSSSGGVGPWDVMASGSWGFNGSKPWLPTPFSAWSKLKLGWITPQNVTQNRYGVAIPSFDAPFSGHFTGVYRLAAGASATAQEYFLVENRQPVGWARDFPVGGLAIWQIDDAVDGNKDDGHRQVELLAADGLGVSDDQLGDGGDLFPGLQGTRVIDGSTSPSTDSRSGTDTNVAVRSIGDAGTTTVADLIVSVAPPADTTPPSVSVPTEQIEGQVTSTIAQLRAFFSATDTGGVAAANVWLKENGVWYDKGNYAGSATSVLFNLPIGRSYQFAVRAKDVAGNWSDYSYGPAFTVETKDDKIFTLGTSWTRYSWVDAYGGTYMTSSAPGIAATLNFTGREVALVAAKFVSAGRASVYCDGVYKGIVDLYSATLKARQVAFRCEFTQSTSHTIKLVLEGTSGRPRVDVDAFVVLR